MAAEIINLHSGDTHLTSFFNDHDLFSICLGWREPTEPCDSHLARFLCLISALEREPGDGSGGREVCMVEASLYSLSFYCG